MIQERKSNGLKQRRGWIEDVFRKRADYREMW